MLESSEGSFRKRLEVCKKHGLCFWCLCMSHLAANCASVCSGCKGKHHILLCRKASKGSCVGSMSDSEKGSGKVEQPVSTITMPSKTCRDKSLLQTASVKVCGDKGPVEAHFPIDIGFDGSHESELLVKLWDPSFRGFQDFSSELVGTGIACKFKRRNFYYLEFLGFV